MNLPNGNDLTGYLLSGIQDVAPELSATAGGIRDKEDGACAECIPSSPGQFLDVASKTALQTGEVSHVAGERNLALMRPESNCVTQNNTIENSDCLDVVSQGRGTTPLTESITVGNEGVSGCPELGDRIGSRPRGATGTEKPPHQVQILTADSQISLEGGDGYRTPPEPIAPEKLPVAIPEIESLARFNGEGETGWNAEGRANIARKMQRIAAGGYNSVDRLIDKVEELAEVGR